MKRIYVAGPYSAGNVLDVLKNIGRGEAVCADLVRRGFAVYCPWHDKSHVIWLVDQTPPVDVLKAQSMAWLEVSDAMLVVSVPTQAMSPGVRDEIDRAKELEIPVFGTVGSLLSWARFED